MFITGKTQLSLKVETGAEFKEMLSRRRLAILG
jgi:hypothetical protein